MPLLSSFTRRVRGIGHSSSHRPAVINANCCSGVHVIVTARRPEVLTEMAAMGMDAIKLDVTSAESIAAAKIEVDKLTGGKLDFLVNNA